MKNWIMRWVASAVALLLIVLAYWEVVEPGAKHFNTSTTPGIWVDSASAIVMAVLALGLANSVIRPIILFFAMPINCLTFGLFGEAGPDRPTPSGAVEGSKPEDCARGSIEDTFIYRVSRCGVCLRQRGQNLASSSRSGSLRRLLVVA